MIPILCIKCHSRLTWNGDEYICSCGKNYPIIDDIPILAEDTNYYGEIPRQQKEKLLREMDNGKYWRDLVWEYFGADYPFLHHIIVDETRNDFKYILPATHNCTVLDLGAGWGTMACYFSRQSKEVVALDGTLDRCRFIRKRCEQDNINNITVVCGNILDRPFSSNCFDIIVMNGVLEWVGASRNKNSPMDSQLHVLKLARDLLKKDGILYIGIENSHGFKYIIGEMDDHTGISHITYLDRQKANEKSIQKLNRPYNTYTYDLHGYKKLLGAAGFSKMQFYYPIPDYKSVQALIPLNNADLTLFYYRNLKQRDHASSLNEKVRALEIRAVKLGHIADYVASYSIISGKSNILSHQSQIHSYLRDNWQLFFSTKPKGLRSVQVSSTPGKRYEKGRIKQFVFEDDKSEPKLIAVYCRSDEYDESLVKEYDIWKVLQSLKLRNIRIPELIHLKKIGDLNVLIRSFWNGESLSSKLATNRYSAETSSKKIKQKIKKDFQLAADCLKELHSRTEKETNSSSCYTEHLFSNLKRAFGKVFDKEISDIIEKLSVLHKNKFDCLIHGDFTPWNILKLKGCIGVPKIGLIDWELSCRCPFKILDYGRFCYYYLTELEKLNLFTKGSLFKDVFIYQKHWLTPTIYKFIRDGQGDERLPEKKINDLMKFMILNDAYLQFEHSIKPAVAIAEHYKNILKIFEE